MIDVWHVQNEALVKRGISASALPTDTFVMDTTRPIWLGTNNPSNNVGCHYGVPRSTVASVTQATGKVHENLNITGQVTITQPGQTFRNCRFTYSYVGDSGGGTVYMMAAILNDGPTTFEFCEIEPNNPGDRYNGLYGHDFVATRCAITKTVDGIGAYNSSRQALNIEIAGCWIGHLAWFDDDRPEATFGHNDGTHNDGIQNGSGAGVSVHGTFWQGAKYNPLNPTNSTITSDGMGFTLQPGNNVTPLTNNSPTAAQYSNVQQSQCYLGAADAYFPVGNIEYHHNWLWNFSTGFKLSSIGGLGTFVIDNVSVHDNIFGGSWVNDGFSQRYYPIRYDTNCIVNGVRRSTAGPFTDTWNNRWDENANPGIKYADGTVVAGSPIRHRVDIVAAP